jgi:DNA mismatch repair ATPase MutS
MLMYGGSLVTPIESRVEDLKDGIQQDLDLLKDYEDALRYEDDPRRILKYRRDIERQQASAAKYQKEYNELQIKMAEVPVAECETISGQMQEVHSMLKQLRLKVDDLQSGQGDILDKLDIQHQEVLDRFVASDQTIEASIIKHLDKTQLETVKTILVAIEAHRVPDEEINETLDAVRQVLSELQHGALGSNMRLTENAEHVSKVLDDPKVDLSHKLKVTLPIIPLLLSYEGEVAMKSGMNLRSALDNLKASVASIMKCRKA